MELKILYLFVLGLAAVCLSNAATLSTNERDARAFVQRASSLIFNNYEEIAHTMFNSPDTDDSEEDKKSAATVIKTAKKLVDIVNESKQYDDSKFTDPELKYIFKIIRKSAEEGILGEEKFVETFESLQMLEELASDKDIPAYHNKSVDLAFFPDIQNIFATSNDPEELKYYWVNWRERNGAWAVSHFLKLIKRIREAAELTGLSAQEYWLHNYDVKEMKKIVKQIRPLYKKLHAFIRNRLYEKYGENVIKLNGPIPHHLFEQVLAQAWTKESIIEEEFPHNELPPYDKILKAANHPTSYLYETATEFYESLGFIPISNKYWNSHIKMSTVEDVGDCKAAIFAETPNVYMEYCQKMDYRTFLQAHGYMAQLYYAREKAELPAYYFDAHNLQYPVGEAVILSASTPKHLKAIGLITEDDFKFTDNVEMNRLLRMGIHTLLNIPVYYVHTRVMSDLFADDVEEKNLNKRYWKLMEMYAGVAPPVDRGEDAYDFPFKFYNDLTDNKQGEKFMTEVLGYQFYQKLCELSGQYDKGSNMKVNECDFYDSREAGDALKRMMKLGSSKPLTEVLEVMFPENPTVSADALLNYYAPMKTWLERVNRRENARTGWVKSDKKVTIVTSIDSSEMEYVEE